MPPVLDSVPGYRRRFLVTPGPDSVTSEMEDDFHRMAVTVRHDGKVATTVESVMWRAPWTTCPGAVAQLQRTFANIALADFPKRAPEKSGNCTHLYDLAVLAAAHAQDAAPLVYDILVSDPIDGRSHAELRRDGATVMAWVHESFRFVEPAELVGLSLDKMQSWIKVLDPRRQEEARVLRWGTMIASGRTISVARQADAARMRMGSCYTFQPDVAKDARREGEVRDFSSGAAKPLDRMH